MTEKFIWVSGFFASGVRSKYENQSPDRGGVRSSPSCRRLCYPMAHPMCGRPMRIASKSSLESPDLRSIRVHDACTEHIPTTKER